MRFYVKVEISEKLDSEKFITIYLYEVLTTHVKK
jgi:hypothetical protein